ncbi:MAG TPA: NAD(P)-dependent oxidoreductase [Parachlamydiales bacterium]|nr:NAD(P)-dependent oxidoreductase [Parachlamydiales bacterium]
MNVNIAIIGCGYVGMEAAALWSQLGHHVTATTRHPERLADLSKVAQKTLILKGDDEEGLASLIAANDVLVVTIAADSADQYENAYLHTSQQIRALALEMDLPRRLIYTSSTSVYGDHRGLWVDETASLINPSEQAKILIQSEKTYLSLSECHWHVCILRLAEIYGPGREISKRIKHMEGHKLPGCGDQYTNMVRKEDVAAAMDHILRYRLEGIYNVVDDEHPTRKELYDQAAQYHHLPSLDWDPALTSIHGGNKRVSNHKIKSEGFVFSFPHRILD